DVVMECSGASAAISPPFPAARPAGVVTQVGMIPQGPQPVDFTPVIAQEVRYAGPCRLFGHIATAEQLLARRTAIDAVTSHAPPPDDPPALFGIARDAERAGKVITSSWGSAI